MVVEQIYNGVFEIKNFLSEEENLKIMNFILTLNNRSWTKDGEKKYFKINGNKSFYFLDNDVRNRVKEIFSSKYNIQEFLAIHKYEKGDKHINHIDNGTKNEIQYGIVIYLNEDFEGGEVFYPDLNIAYKPQENSLLFHKADIWHEVLPVKHGNRYVLTTFAIDANK